MSHFTDRFTSTLPGVRVRFGPGIRHEVAAEMDSLGLSRALILTTPQQADTGAEFAQALGGRAAGLFSGAAMHTPTLISEEATALALTLGVDCRVAIGGGSTTGLGKAIALRTDLPQIVVPTTYAGSEATGILGQTENGQKTTITTPKVQPEVILYDAELVRTLPVAMTVTSALNAMAHAAEGLYAQNRSPLSTLMAIEGLRAFRDALPRVLDNPDDLTARGETLYAAWLCGTVLGTVGMALHHKLCHTLGGSFDLPHAETHSIILPHAIAYNEPAAARELAPIADLFGAATPGLALHTFAIRMRAPTALRDIGMKEADVDRAAVLATQSPYWNPQPVEAQALRRLLQDAWDGSEPFPELKAYLKDVIFPFRSVFNIDSRKGSNDLEAVFGRRDLFKNPKSVELLSYLLSFVVGKEDLVLDSFGGSGTTAHAVLEMNAQDQGNRRFIVVEMDSDTASDVTAERLRRVISGYDKGGDRTKPVAGLGGGFRFCRLGVPLFDEYGDVAQEVTFPDLAAHIFFSETGAPIPARAQSELLGVHQGRAVYLLFDAAHAGHPREAAGNVLIPDRLQRLPDPPEGFDGLRVIYAEGCTVSPDRLKAHSAVFKQIPYQVEGV